jgi:outer membrane protein insertion porin family
VRGYEQNTLDGTAPADTSQSRPEGGLASLLVSLELRFPIWGRLSGVGFVDAGNVWQSWELLRGTHVLPQGRDEGVLPEDVRYCYGLGLRFGTPLGPVRFDYAWRWNVPEGDHDKREKWHVAIGHAF